MRALRKVGKFFVAVLVAMSCLAWIFALIALLVFAPRFGFVKVVSGSMEPAIMEGELVLVESIKTQDCKLGDIIVYEIDNGIKVIHRVVDKGTKAVGSKLITYLRTQGDANDFMDSVEITNQHDVKKLVASDTWWLNMLNNNGLATKIVGCLVLLIAPMWFILWTEQETPPEVVEEMLAKSREEAEKREKDMADEKVTKEVCELKDTGECSSENCEECMKQLEEKAVDTGESTEQSVEENYETPVVKEKTIDKKRPSVLKVVEAQLKPTHVIGAIAGLALVVGTAALARTFKK